MLKPYIELFVDPVFLILFSLMRVCMCDTLLFPIKFFVSLVRDLNVLRKYWNLKNVAVWFLIKPWICKFAILNSKVNKNYLIKSYVFFFRSWKWWWWWLWSLVFVGFRTILTSFGATLTQQSICRNISR